MLFPSIVFLFYFLPAVLVLYYSILGWNIQLRNLLLLAASILFYAWGEPRYVGLLLFSCLLNWLMGLLIEHFKASAKPLLAAACVMNLMILGYYKYLGFLIRTLNAVAGMTLMEVPEIPQPIGISFFTFQAMSYVIDVYRGTAKAQKNLLSLSLYIALFPQLVAGPIVRYGTVEEQILHRKHSMQLFGDGVWRFAQGLAKKLLLANSFAGIADHIYSLTMAGHSQLRVPLLLAWIGSFAYTLQIFFDFSGYSDMAIGLGKMFGFTFEENFNDPYISKTIGEFWRRWHISLGTWFREYVYFPLGGSHVENKDIMVRNLFVVWLLTGLWHGASWTFVLWGIWNFIFLLLERLLLMEQWKGPVWFKHLYTLFVVNLGWVLFRCENFYQFGEYFGNLFGMNRNGFCSSMVWMFLREYAVFWMAGILLSTPALTYAKEKLSGSYPGTAAILERIVQPLCMSILFLVCLAYLIKGGYNPFIYFNF